MTPVYCERCRMWVPLEHEPHRKTPDDPPHYATTKAAPRPRDRCGACGHFLAADSLYTNRCGNCWGPEDEFLY